VDAPNPNLSLCTHVEEVWANTSGHQSHYSKD